MALELINLVSESETEATVRYMCDVAERGVMKQAMLGGYQNVGSPPVLSFIVPAAYPYNSDWYSDFYAKSVKTVWPSEAAGATGKVWLDVTFTSPTPADKKDDPGADPIDLYSVSVRVAAEGVKIPKQNYTIADAASTRNGEALSEEDVEVLKWMPTIEVVFRSDKVAALKTRTMSGKVGRLNNSTFSIPRDDDYDNGMVLFLGSNSDQKRTTEGFDFATRELTFNVRENGGKGWNSIWSAKDNDYVTISPALYPSTSFDALFT